MIWTAGNKEVCQGWVGANAMEEKLYVLQTIMSLFSPLPALAVSPPPSCGCPPW